MTVEISLLISGISVAVAIFFGMKNQKRSDKQEIKENVSELTTVLVKLEVISSGISEIKNELSNVKSDMKENRERIIKVEESTKQAHRRLDNLEHRLDGQHEYEREN